MPEPVSGSVFLLQADPDLARDLDGRRAREAAARVFARALHQPRGRFCPAELLAGTDRPLGLLLLEGLVVCLHGRALPENRSPTDTNPSSRACERRKHAKKGNFPDCLCGSGRRAPGASHAARLLRGLAGWCNWQHARFWLW